MLTSQNKLTKEGRHVGLDFYDLLIEALIDRVMSAKDRPDYDKMTPTGFSARSFRHS
jgi:hypothetical protein